MRLAAAGGRNTNGGLVGRKQSKTCKDGYGRRTYDLQVAVVCWLPPAAGALSTCVATTCNHRRMLVVHYRPGNHDRNATHDAYLFSRHSPSLFFLTNRGNWSVRTALCDVSELWLNGHFWSTEHSNFTWRPDRPPHWRLSPRSWVLQVNYRRFTLLSTPTGVAGMFERRQSVFTHAIWKTDAATITKLDTQMCYEATMSPANPFILESQRALTCSLVIVAASG